MTDTFGVDLSSYQTGENLSDLPGIDFVIAKATEGDSYVDPAYADWVAAAARAAKMFVGYHFLLQAVATAAQVANMARQISTATPVMLDVETEGTSKPTFADILAFIDAATARGYRVKLVYLPKWYWLLLGSPDLTPLTARGVGVISSAYPRSASAGTVSTYAADSGDSGAGWAPYGGVTPVLWQYADDDSEDGRPNDVNAYRGTRAQLAMFLGAAAASVPTVALPLQENDVPYLISVTPDPTRPGETTATAGIFIVDGGTVVHVDGPSYPTLAARLGAPVVVSPAFYAALMAVAPVTALEPAQWATSFIGQVASDLSADAQSAAKTPPATS